MLPSSASPRDEYWMPPMIKAKLAIASAVLFATGSAFAQSAVSPNAKPDIPAPNYEKPPTSSANPADNPASTGTQGGDAGVSGGKDVPAAGAEVGPGR